MKSIEQCKYLLSFFSSLMYGAYGTGYLLGNMPTENAPVISKEHICEGWC